MNALGFGGVGIGNSGGVIDEAGASAEEDVGVVGILFGERLENRQSFDMFLLVEKGDSKFALGLVSRMHVLGKCVAKK